MADTSQTCQRCYQPLLLDPSIANLTPASHSLITSSLPSSSAGPSGLTAAQKLAAIPPSGKEAAAIWSSSKGINHNPNVAESFIFLGDSVLPGQSGSSTSKSPTARSSNDGIPGSTGTSLNRTSSSQNGHPRHPIPPDHLLANLHEIISRNTPIDHPLCVECTGLLQSELQKSLEKLSRERDAYIAFERGIARNREEKKSKRSIPISTPYSNHPPFVPTSKSLIKSLSRSASPFENEELGEYDIQGTEEEWEDLLRQKRELEKEEVELRKALAQREKELEQVRLDEIRIKVEEEEMEAKEKDFLLDHFESSTVKTKKLHALQTARTQYLLSQNLLRHLEATNVWNDAFHIGHTPFLDNDGKGSGITVGTINGLRLGGRPTVEWDEINAAWGLVALCADRIANKIGCVFEQYKIVPMGSYSKIEELPPSKAVYELFASSDYNILHNRRFSIALVAVLDCLRQLIEFGKRSNRGWASGGLEIHKDKISGHSIKLPGLAGRGPTLPSMSIMGLGSSSTKASSTSDGTSGGGGSGNIKEEGTAEEQWTRACRAVLWALKRILVVESEADRQEVASHVPGQ